MENALDLFFDKINDLESNIDNLSEQEMRDLLKQIFSETQYTIVDGLRKYENFRYNKKRERVYHD